MIPELASLKLIHIKLLIATALVAPFMTAASAYWGLKLQIEETRSESNQQVSDFKLDIEKTFTKQTSYDKLEKEVRAMHDDVLLIKTLLLQQHRR